MLLDIPIGQDLILTYATPILLRRWPQTETLNSDLRELLLDRERNNPQFRADTLRRSNLGGWRSEPDLLSWGGDAIEQFRKLIMDGLGDVLKLCLGPNPGNKRIKAEPVLTAWANINRRGSYNVVHNHPNADWSGVYYVAIGESDKNHPLSGAFEFHDPRPAAAVAPTPGYEFGQKMTFQPEPGTMIIFPSWHNHMVHPFFGNGERISIAFNVKLNNFQIAR